MGSLGSSPPAPQVDYNQFVTAELGVVLQVVGPGFSERDSVVAV